MREILRRSLAIATREGVDALTIGRLAGDLDYTPGALYRYFASKDALVAELQRSVVAYLGDAIARATAGAEAHANDDGLDRADTALLRVATATLGFAEFGKRMPAAFGFLSMYLSDPEYRLSADDARTVHSATRDTLKVLGRLYDEATIAGAILPGDGAARALSSWAALQGVMQTRKLVRNDPEAVDVDALVREMIRTLLVGWGGDADRADLAIDCALKHDLHVFPGSIEEFLDEPEQTSSAAAGTRK